MFTGNLKAYLKFTRNIIEVSDRSRSGIRGWHERVEYFEPVYGNLFFVRRPMKNKFFIAKTAILAKIHCFQRIHPYKMRALCAEKNFFALFCRKMSKILSKDLQMESWLFVVNNRNLRSTKSMTRLNRFHLGVSFLPLREKAENCPNFLRKFLLSLI